MDDLNLDDLANCPTPDDALLLLSAGAAEAMQKIPEFARLEVCKTIVALGDVVARTHAPNIAAIKLSLREDGGIESTAEANGRIFHRRSDNGVIAGMTGAISALARMESKQRTGKAHARGLDAWGNALIEAGQYLVEIAIIARGIASEMKQEDAPTMIKPEDAPPKFRSGITPVRLPPEELEPDGIVRSQERRGGRPVFCKKVYNPTGPDAFNCMRLKDHDGDCAPKVDT